MKRLIFLALAGLVFLLQPRMLLAQTTLPDLTRLEYFFDTDPGLGQATALSITPGTSLDQNFTVPVNILSNGFHLLGIRAKDSNGRWSIVQFHPFIKENIDPAGMANLVAGEYFFNSDPGYGQGTPIPVTAGAALDISFTASIAPLSNGFHMLYARFKDQNGLWSMLYKQPFLKEAVSTTTLPQLTKLEYFLDSDPGYGQGTAVPISSGSAADMSLTVGLSGVQPGFHVLFLRARDAANGWSLLNTKAFLLEDIAPGQVSDIVAAEYYVDTDPGYGSGTPIPVTPGPTQNLSAVVDLSNVANGFHAVYIRVKNASGRWSITNYKPFFRENNVITAALPNITGLRYTITQTGNPNVQAPQTYTRFVPATSADVFFNPATCVSAPGNYFLRIHGVDEHGTPGIDHVHAFYSAGNSAPQRIVQTPDAIYPASTAQQLVVHAPSVFGDNDLVNGDVLTFSAQVLGSLATAFVDTDLNVLISTGPTQGQDTLVIYATDKCGNQATDTVAFSVNIPAQLATGGISPLSYCHGSSVTVPYTATGTYNAGNVFTAQLSDAAGSFASPVVIGAVSSTETGFINATLPTGIAGAHYRIRVVSSEPALAGSSNGVDIAIRATPTVSDAGTAQVICAPATTLNANAATTGTGTWTVVSGSGIFTDANDPAAQVSGLSTGPNILRWTIANAPCPASESEVTITQDPQLTIANAGTNQQVCGETATLSANTPTIGSGNWTLVSGSGDLTSAGNASTTVTNLGLGDNVFQWTISGGTCVPTQDQVTITRYAVPAMPVATSNSPLCAGHALALTAIGSGSATYSWSGPAGFSSVEQMPVLANAAVAQSGTYSVRAVENGCASAWVTLAVVVNTQVATPVASAASPVCSGQVLALTASEVPGATYSWSGPAGFSSSDQNPVLPNTVVGNSGTYSVFALSNGCVSQAGLVTVAVNATPAAPAAFSNSPLCEGQTLNLSAAFQSDATYSWVGPGGFTAGTQLAQLPAAVTTASGIFSVFATVNGCTSEAGTVAVSVNTLLPEPAISANGPLCEGATLQLSATSVPGAAYAWSGPNGFSSGMQNPVLPGITLAEAGQYTVIATHNGCPSDPALVMVTVHAVPGVPTAGSNSPVCANQALLLTAATGGGTTFSWTGPGGFYSPNQNPTLSNALPGTYAVFATANGCTSAGATTLVEVTPLQDAGFSYSGTSFCKTGVNPVPVTSGGNSGTFSATPAGLAFTSANTGEIALALSSAGTYTVTFTTAGPCAGSSSVTITITNPPSANFSYAGPFCQQNASAMPTFAAGAVAGTFSASPAGLVLLNTTTGEVNLQASAPGIYTVTNTLSASNGCAPVTAINMIEIRVTPSVSASNSGPVCAGQTATLSANAPAGATFIWAGPQGFSANSQVAVLSQVTAAAAGLYSVTALLNGCASAPATTSLAVNTAVVTPGTGNSGPVCAGNSVQLSASAIAGASYSWSGPNGFASTSQDPVVSAASVSQAGLYSVFAQVNGCLSEPGITLVEINPIPALSGMAPGTVCAGGTLQLTATIPAGATVSWTGPNGFSASGNAVQMLQATAANSGTYSATASLNGCVSDPATVVVSVEALPNVSASASVTTICVGSPVGLSASGAAQFSWAGSGLSAASGAEVTATPATPGTYTFTVTGSENGCAATAQVLVEVDPCLCPGNAPVFSYSGNPNHTASAVSPANGEPSQTYHFEVSYSDADGELPAPGFPKMYLDFEGDGIFTGPSDFAFTLIAQDPSDTDVLNGKVYYANMPGLPVNTNYSLQFSAADAAGCTGTWTVPGPDVLVAPDLAIYASDISFSSANPSLSSPQVVSAVVRNNSTTTAQNFVVRLINHADLTAVYPDMVVASLSPNSSATVNWTITTPAAAGWIPMQVIVDQTNTVTESNELNNQAIRPFINGDFSLSGFIELEAQSIPSSVCPQPGQYFSICGFAYYQNTAVQLQDSSVAGATVTVLFPQTGQTFSGLTNSAGQFCISLPAPVTTGNYTYQISVTDFSLTGSGTTNLTVLPPCPVVVPNGPDLTACYSGPGSVFEGGTVAGVIIVSNTGNQPSNPTQVNVSVTNGTPATVQFQVPAIAANDSVHLTLPVITNGGLGYMAVSTVVDPANLVTEQNEGNNTCLSQIQVCPVLPNLTASVASAQVMYFCNNTTSFRIFNPSCVGVNSPFGVQVQVYENGNLIGTHNQTVAQAIAANNYAHVSFQNLFPAPGNYLVEFTIDGANQLAELNEADNQWNGGFVLTECRPDLSITSCNTVLPVNPGANSSLQVTATVFNGGNAVAIAPFTVHLNVGGVLHPATVLNNLAPNAATQVTVTLANPSGMCNTGIFTVDGSNEVMEFNEGNNTSAVQLYHDFQPAYFCGGIMFWQYTHLVGQPVPLSVGLANSGGFRASQVKTRFEVTGPGIPNWLDLGYATNNNVQQTCACPYGAGLPQPFIFPETGVYTVRMTADADNSYTECNEANNVLVVQVTITNLPNYRVLSQHIAPSLLNPQIGEPISITTTYENLGAAAVTDSLNLTLLVNDVAHQTVRVKGTGAGQTNSVQLSSQWSSTIPGVHILRAVIDSGNEINEGNEADNEATRAVVVGETANLLFAQFAPSNASPALGSIITLDAQVENAGAVATEADVLFFYLTDANDTVQIGQQFISLAANSSVSLSLPWVVADASTTVLARIVNSTIIESDYTDNSASALIGGMSLAFSTSPACANATNGSAVVTVTGGLAPYTFQWSNGQTTEDLSGAPGTYSLNVTDATGTTVSGSVLIDALPVPVLAVSASALQVCAGQPVSLTAYGAENYTWSNGMSGSVIVVWPAATASYTVTASSPQGCTVDSVVTIAVLPVVSASANSNSPVTEGDTLLLWASGASSYTWSGPNGFASSLQNPAIGNAPVAASGTYTVIAGNGTCSDTAFVAVVVNAITAPPCTTALNGGYTVNAALATGGTNFQSFAALAQALNTTGVCGPVVVEVVPGSGPYQGQLVLGQIPGASAQNTVTLNGNGEALWRCSNTSGQHSALVYLDGTDYLTIDGLILAATCNRGTGFWLTNGTDHITLRNNLVLLPLSTATGNTGLYASAPGRLELLSNSFTGGRRSLQVLNTTDSLLVEGNTFAQAYEYGMSVVNASGVLLKGNRVELRAGYLASLGLTATGLHNFAIEGNWLTGAGRAGIQLNNANTAAGAGQGLVANNRIGGFQQHSGTAYGLYFYTIRHTATWHNSAELNTGLSGGVFRVGGAQGLDVRNNIFSYSGSGNVQALYGAPSAFSQLSHNNYFSTGSGLLYLNQQVGSLAALGTLGYNVVGSFNQAPQFDGELRSQNVLLRDVATAAVLVAEDFEGDARQSGTVDLGADEVPVTARQQQQSLASEVYPNPFDNQLSIKLSGETAGDVQVTLTDLMGRQVMTQHYAVEAGTTSLEVNLEQAIAQGVYLLQLTQGDATATFRVVKQ